MVKILIIEDHKILIDGIRALLTGERYCKLVYEAQKGKVGLEYVKNHQDIDIVLLDINLPDISGVEVCEEIRKIRPKLPILTLTMHESTTYLRKMIHAGANGYILKDATGEELVSAIKTVVEGKLFLSKRMKELMNNASNNLQDQSANKKTPRLTTREIEVLKYIINEFTTEEIAKELFISAHTVISHRKNILKKFKAKNTAGIVKAVYENDVLINQILEKK